MSNLCSSQLIIGIDGGGSTCRVRLSDQAGNKLSEVHGGAANLRLGVQHVMAVIQQTVEQALTQARLNIPLHQLRAGIGLAGYVLDSDIQAAEPIRRLFASCDISNDAYIACLGAHQGQAGGIIITGTGSCAQIICAEESRTFGGWGFNIGDQASGAILGREAVRLSLLALEGLVQKTLLTDTINQQFSYQAAQYLEWSLQAKPADYAVFARTVVQCADAGDPQANRLLKQSMDDLLLMFNALKRYNTGRISLMGGLASVYKRYLPESIQQELTPIQGDALDGALLLARHIRPEQLSLCQ